MEVLDGENDQVNEFEEEHEDNDTWLVKITSLSKIQDICPSCLLIIDI